MRPGRSVSLAHARLSEVKRERAVASAAAWLFPRSTDGPAPAGPPLGHTPADGITHPRPDGWSPGYLDAVEWRWISGGVADAGPMRNSSVSGAR